MISLWNNADAAKRYKRPELGAWSLTETVLHLELVQNECMRSMQDRLASGIKKPGSLTFWWRFIRLRMAMRSMRKFKAPTVVIPPADEMVIRKWNPDQWLQSLQELETFYQNLPRDYKNILLFKHPLAGPMHARHALIFLLDHLGHHERTWRNV
jgi:hypothetical protein